MTAKFKLIFWCSMVVLFLFQCGFLSFQQKQINQQKIAIQAKDGEIAGLNAGLQDARAAAKKQQNDILLIQSENYELMQKTFDLSDQNTAQKNQIRKLRDENKNVQSWLDSPVPADIVCLLGGNTATGRSDHTD